METAGETADTGKDWTGVCGPSTSTHIFARSKPNNSYEYACGTIPFETSERKGAR
jgi:hypothetical protein